jgi:hypothetical protein
MSWPSLLNLGFASIVPAFVRMLPWLLSIGTLRSMNWNVALSIVCARLDQIVPALFFGGFTWRILNQLNGGSGFG